MPLTTMQQDGGLSDINNLLNLVKDQNTTSSTSSNITNAGVQQQINEILGDNAGLASVAGAQHAAGFYSSSTNTQLVNDLLTRTAANVAAKNATVTTSQSKKAPLSKTNALLTIGSLALKNSSTAKAAYQKLTGMLGSGAGPGDESYSPITEALTPADMQAAGSGLDTGSAVGETMNTIPDVTGTISNALTDAGFGASDADVASALANTAPATTDVAGLETLDSAAASSDAGGTAAAAAAANTPDAAGLAALDSDAVTTGGDAVSGLGASAETTDAGSTGIGGTAAAGWGALAVATAVDANATQSGNDSNAKNFLDYTGDVGTSDVIRGLDSGNVIDSVNPLGQGALEAIGVPSSGGWIVCTELVRQGRMPRKYYVSGLRVFNSYRQDLLAGYYIWAIPAVALLKEKPHCLRSRFICWFFNHRAEFLASRSNVASARDTVIGQMVSAAVYGFCWVLGMYLKHTRNAQPGEFV